MPYFSDFFICKTVNENLYYFLSIFWAFTSNQNQNYFMDPQVKITYLLTVTQIQEC